jgi:hypothetical protein
MSKHDPMPWIEQPVWWPQKVDDFRAAVKKEGGPELSADPEEAWLQLLTWEWEEAGRRLKTDPGHLWRMSMIERMVAAAEQERLDLAVEIVTEERDA